MSVPIWSVKMKIEITCTYNSEFIARCFFIKVPIIDVNLSWLPLLVERFWDIPSPWWQASTILVGTGSALSLLIAVTATAACCITFVIHSGNAKIAGSAQLLSALLVIGGAAVYPVGWDNREVRESCGNSSHIYRLGTCQLSWSFLRISGESRLVSDLSVQRRHVTEQRIALRLAHPIPASSNSVNCISDLPGTSKNQLPLKIVHVETENVPLSPALEVSNISDAVKSLPKCLMHSDGNVFD
ncbi:hypothetical protein HHI36_017806 [Cryptolaemus montrouzieri]|uniref:Uncharacterized protein n=1 Tax=Cryptolaemus montrouzieri TaxID=559131 RepID=A0ABD2NPF7_9CUCU